LEVLCPATSGCGEVSWMRRILVFEVAEGLESYVKCESWAV